MRKILSVLLVLSLMAVSLYGLTATTYAADVMYDNFSVDPNSGITAWSAATNGHAYADVGGIHSNSGHNTTVFGTLNQLWYDWNTPDAAASLTYTGDFGGQALIAYFCVDDSVTNSAAFVQYCNGADRWGAYYEMYQYYLQKQLVLSAGSAADNMTQLQPTYVFGGSTPGGGQLAFAVAVNNLPAGTQFVKIGTQGTFPGASWQLRWLGVKVEPSGTAYMDGYSYKDTSAPIPLGDFKDDFSTLTGLVDRKMTDSSTGRKYLSVSNFYTQQNWNTKTQLDGSWFVNRIQGPGWDWFPECSITYFGNFDNKLLSVIVSADNANPKSDWLGAAKNIGLSIYAGSTVDTMTKISPTHYRHGTAEDLANSSLASAVDIIVESLPVDTHYIKVAFDSANWHKNILQIQATSDSATYLAKPNVESAGPVAPAEPSIASVNVTGSTISTVGLSANNTAGTLIVAFYVTHDSGQTVLEDVSTYPVTAASYTGYAASITVNKTIPGEGSYKVMFWDSLSGLKPLCASAD